MSSGQVAGPGFRASAQVLGMEVQSPGWLLSPGCCLGGEAQAPGSAEKRSGVEGGSARPEISSPRRPCGKVTWDSRGLLR